jgi:hypothetical protein
MCCVFQTFRGDADYLLERLIVASTIKPASVPAGAMRELVPFNFDISNLPR